MSVIVPAPTVRPPSRMANRKPFSSATGAISSPLIVVLSLFQLGRLFKLI